MTLERMTGLLTRAGINPNGYGERVGESVQEHAARVLRESERETVARIVAEDVRDNWPRIEAERVHTSATQCHCTDAACAKAEGFQRHPCGRCVREGERTVTVDGKQVTMCAECVAHAEERS